jgi:hypothetical protein
MYCISKECTQMTCWTKQLRSPLSTFVYNQLHGTKSSLRRLQLHTQSRSSLLYWEQRFTIICHQAQPEPVESNLTQFTIPYTHPSKHLQHVRSFLSLYLPLLANHMDVDVWTRGLLVSMESIPIFHHTSRPPNMMMIKDTIKWHIYVHIYKTWHIFCTDHIAFTKIMHHTVKFIHAFYPDCIM